MRNFFYKHPILLKIVKAIILAITAVLPNAIIDKLSHAWIIIISIVACLLLFFILQQIEKWMRKDYENLLHLLNVALKQKKEIKKVSQHLIESKEGRQPENSEIHLLVNDIRNYDLVLPAIEVICNNIKKGVRYIYYAPSTQELRNDFNELNHLLREHIISELLTLNYAKAGAEESAEAFINNNLVVIFFPNEDEFLYNFSYSISSGEKNRRNILAQWYLLDQHSEQEEDNLVLRVNFTSPEDVERLRKTFLTLLKSEEFECSLEKTLKKEFIKNSLLSS